LQSGLAAGECAIAALTNSGPDHFTNYEQRMKAAWGREYRLGRYFHKVVGIPAITNAGLKLLNHVNHPGFRAHFLFWEGWRDAEKAVRREQQGQGDPAGS
jgi:flavin-dependent dehydrogenase